MNRIEIEVLECSPDAWNLASWAPPVNPRWYVGGGVVLIFKSRQQVTMLTRWWPGSCLR